MDRHSFRIEANAVGMGTQIYMDGKPLQGVTGYSLSYAVGRKSGTRLVLVMQPERVDVIGEATKVARVKR